MENIRRWYLDNYSQITWFLIGWLCLGGVVNFGRGEYLT